MPLSPPVNEPCPFCEALAGRGSRDDWAIVEEGPSTLAFIAPKPLRSGHVLVIVKRHAVTILDLDPEELTGAMRHVQRVARAVAEELDASGLNIFQNNGVSAGQTVAHYHVHILPSHPGNDPHRFVRPEERVHVPLADRVDLARRIAGRLR